MTVADEVDSQLKQQVMSFIHDSKMCIASETLAGNRIERL
jgi:hypothetical protein